MRGLRKTGEQEKRADAQAREVRYVRAQLRAMGLTKRRSNGT